MLLEFDWGVPLLAYIDVILDSGDRLPGSSGSHGKIDRGQASPYSPGARVGANAGRAMRVGPLWYTHHRASYFDPNDNTRWKLIVNDAWYGFYVKTAT